MYMHRILVIEDEPHLAELIRKGLEEDNYSITHCLDGILGIEALQKDKFDLVILDILLPKLNGLEVCRRIRESGLMQIPILMLTALNSAENVALGLDSGADDYLSKPFKLVELKARIRSLLRRKELTNNNLLQKNSVYRFADIELDDDSKTVKRNNNLISLTSTEYRLLLMFLKHPNKVLARLELLEEVWGYNFDSGTNVVDVYINYLRRKLDKYGNNKLIHTVVGMGYVLKDGE